MSHRSSPPERVGLASVNKQIIPAGGRRLALPLMAAEVSLEDLLDVFYEEYTDNPVFQQIRKRRNGRLNPRYWASHQALKDSYDLQTPALQPLAIVDEHPKEPAKWLASTQELFGKALARAIAHEARHLYIPKHAAAGLGADSPQLLGRHFERFSVDDRRAILNSIRGLERTQGNATVVETFPMTRRNLDFPF